MSCLVHSCSVRAEHSAWKKVRTFLTKCWRKLWKETSDIKLGHNWAQLTEKYGPGNWMNYTVSEFKTRHLINWEDLIFSNFKLQSFHRTFNFKNRPDTGLDSHFIITSGLNHHHARTIFRHQNHQEPSNSTSQNIQQQFKSVHWTLKATKKIVLLFL